MRNITRTNIEASGRMKWAHASRTALTRYSHVENVERPDDEPAIAAPARPHFRC